jgi:hypothetical protein
VTGVGYFMVGLLLAIDAITLWWLFRSDGDG